MTGKTKTMKFTIKIDNISNSTRSITTASIKNISKYKGNVAGIVVNNSDIASLSPIITKEQTITIMNKIIDSALYGINWTLVF